MNLLQYLPAEIIQKILLLLEPEDIHSFWNCNRSMRNLIAHSYFWRKKYQMDGFHLAEKLKNSPVYGKLCKSFNYWQASYLFILFLNYNWKKNLFRAIEFDKSIETYMINYVNDEIIIVTAGNDRTSELFLLNSSTGKLENWIGSIGTFKAISVFENMLVFAENRIVRVWNLDSRSLVSSAPFTDRTDEIIKVFTHKNLLGVLFSNRECYMLNMDGTGLWKLGNANVHDVYFYEDLVICQYNHGNVNILNLKDLSWKELVCCETPYFARISIKNKCLVSLCCNSHVCTWDVETSSRFFLFTAESSLYPSNPIYFCDQNKFIFSMQFSNNAEVWNYETRSQVFKIDNKEKIDSIQSNSRFIYIFSPKWRLVKLWCVVTGKYVGCLNLQSFYNSVNILFSVFSVTETQLFIYYRSPIGIKCYILDYEHGIETEY